MEKNVSLVSEQRAQQGEVSLCAVVSGSDSAVAVIGSRWPKWPGKQGMAHTAVVTVVISHSVINAHNQRCLRTCVRTHMQGFACLLQPNSELQSDNRELWVISHHASSGTAGGQEPHHISSHSDLGGKLPSLNSDVQERERGSQKTRACDTQWGSRMEDGRALRMKETPWNKMRSCYSHLNVEKPWCSIDQGSFHYVWSSKDKSIIQFHFDENRSERRFSFLSFLRLYFSLSH